MNDSFGKLKQYLYNPYPMDFTSWLVDFVIALGVFGFGMIQLALSANVFVPDPFTRMILGIHRIGPNQFEVLATILMSAPLVVRRRFPWPCFIVTLAFWVFFDAWFETSSLSMTPVLVALFTISYEQNDRQAIAAGLISLIAIIFTQFFMPSNGLSSLLLFQNSCMAIAVAFAGSALHARQEKLAAIEARASEMERVREAEASKRVEEERVRIARELHDITAHSLSAVSIQAAAAERLVDSDPEAAKSAIEQVRSTSKNALSDLRAMVGVLRSGEDAELNPTEGTERMASLETYLEGAGIQCDLFMLGYDRNHVPVHVDVALYGIAREACTNIVKHSGATKAVIDLRELDDQVMLSVFDNGRGMGDASDAVQGSDANSASGANKDQSANSATDKGVGHGVEGMRERVKLLNGEFSITAAPESGTCIRVVIPAVWKEL